jgi:hypothetical protein
MEKQVMPYVAVVFGSVIYINKQKAIGLKGLLYEKEIILPNGHTIILHSDNFIKKGLQ